MIKHILMKHMPHRGGGALLIEKWGTGICSPEDPLFMPSLLAVHEKLHFGIFQFSRSYFRPNHKFLEILSSEAVE